MKFLILALITLSLSKTSSAESMKLEGSCTGTLLDDTAISFNYYSNFNGCRKVNRGAISFTSGMEDLLVGKRSFSDGKDVYSFKETQNRMAKEVVRLTFNDSTGNTSGKFYYLDEDGKGNTIEVKCDIRDYEYTDC